MSLSPQEPFQKSWHRVFRGNMLEIPSAASWVESITGNLNLADSKAYAMQVCLEELMSNTVRYGKLGSSANPPQADPAPVSIPITIDAFADRTVMTFEDNSQPFNIEQAPAKSVDRPLEQLQPGGLGIHLIKSFSSKLKYSRTEKGNCVVVEFVD